MIDKRIWHSVLAIFIIFTGLSAIYATSYPLNIWGLVLSIIAGMSSMTVAVVFYFVEEEEGRKSIIQSAWLTMFVSAGIVLAYGAYYPISNGGPASSSAILCNSTFPIIIIIIAGILLKIQKRGQP